MLNLAISQKEKEEKYKTAKKWCNQVPWSKSSRGWVECCYISPKLPKKILKVCKKGPGFSIPIIYFLYEIHTKYEIHMKCSYSYEIWNMKLIWNS